MVETPEADDVTEDDFVIASYVGDSGLEMNDTHATRCCTCNWKSKKLFYSFLHLFIRSLHDLMDSFIQSITHTHTPEHIEGENT